MPERKRPVFGTISLLLMLGLVVAGVLITLFTPAPPPAVEGEGLAVALEAVANAVAILLAIVSVSFCAALLALVSLIRRERPIPAAVSLCLALPSLIVVIFSITQM